jgi:hypothetical protein
MINIEINITLSRATFDDIEIIHGTSHTHCEKFNYRTGQTLGRLDNLFLFRNRYVRQANVEVSENIFKLNALVVDAFASQRVL